MQKTKREFSWRFLHNLLAIFVVVSFLTGMRIATLTKEKVLFFSYFLPTGYVHGIHLISAIGLISVVGIYSIYKT